MRPKLRVTASSKTVRCLRPLTALLLAGALLSAAAGAAAEKPSQAALSAARTLGYEGVEAYQAGDYKTAANKLDLAFSVVKVPTVGLWSARAFAKVGKLVEAHARYTTVAGLSVGTGRTEAQEAAKAAAVKEAQELVARIPTIQIMIEGAPTSECIVYVDDRLLKAKEMSDPIRLNPGAHGVTAKLASETLTKQLSLEEGDREKVLLRFSGVGLFDGPALDEPAADQNPKAQGDARPTEDRGPAEPEDPGATQRTVGWVGVGVGGAGLVVGLTTGMLAWSAKGGLSDSCEGDVCDDSVESDVNTYNSLRTVSLIGFIVGGVGGAAGVTLLLTAPSAPEKAAVIRPWVGIGSAGVTGTF